MADDVVILEVSERIATITLNRPTARNAINRDLRAALPAAMLQAEADDEVDVIILTGADPAFCAGLDLKELGSGTAGEVDSAVTGDGRKGPFPELSKPVIGAVNGAAITGGLEIALNCDFLVASERARFADTHARVGLQPGWGLTVLLAQAVGVRRAKELSTTGNVLDAPTALAWGLVNHVVAHDELLSVTRRIAADISSNDQAGVRRLVQTYNEGALTTGEEAWRNELTIFGEWIRSQANVAGDVEARRHAVMERGRAQSR